MAPNNFKAMLDHLFMVHKLSPDNSEEAETELLSGFTYFVSKDESLSSHLLELLTTLSSFHHSPPTLDQLSSIFNKETFVCAVPLLEHNAVLLFNKAANKHKNTVVISTLDVLPNKQSIHSVSAEPLHTAYANDCRMAIPRSTLHNPVDSFPGTTCGTRKGMAIFCPKSWP